MDEDLAFTEGVRPGSINTSHEIIILICEMLRSIGKPVTLEQIREALLEEELVNYFECTATIASMLKSGHLVEFSDGAYILSARGSRTAEEFADTLPIAVRERGCVSLRQLIARERSTKENDVQVEKRDDGYRITMTIKDIGTDLMSLSLFMPDRESCTRLQKRFLADPAGVYQSIYTALTGDERTFSTKKREGKK